MNKILILLSTYNGEKYLQAQLDSLFSQTYKNFELIVRDDGSTDKTIDILKTYNIKLLPSDKNLGVKKSFEILLKYAIDNSDSDYCMFCDQDDVWMSNKLENTLSKILELENNHGSNMPLLVFTDMKVVDSELNLLHDSFWKYQKLDPNISQDWKNVLAQNVITGCTMMINKSAQKISFPFELDEMLHDHWIGINVSKYGKIGYIDAPTLLYRQHSNNAEGAHRLTFLYIIKKTMDIKTTIKKLYFAAFFFKEVSFIELFTKKLKINIDRLFR